MRVGDLPRARVPVEHRGGPVFRALLVALTIGLLLALWQVLPASQANESSVEGTVAAVDQAAAADEATAPAPVAVAGPDSTGDDAAPAAPSDRTPPVRVVEASPAQPGSSALFSAEATFPQEPAHTGSHGAALSAMPSGDRPPVAPQAAPVEASPPFPATPARTAVASAGQAAVSLPAEPDRAGSLVDLNTASLEELNSLRGGGLIGRAIIRGRPYASVEDLVKKRVLNRSKYQRIQDQVTVR